jgi:hypothetical protein
VPLPLLDLWADDVAAWWNVVDWTDVEQRPGLTTGPGGR